MSAPSHRQMEYTMWESMTGLRFQIILFLQLIITKWYKCMYMEYRFAEISSAVIIHRGNSSVCCQDSEKKEY